MSGQVDHDPEGPPDSDVEQEPAFKPLTRDEVSELLAGNPSVSPWRILVAQAVVGLVCVLVTWGVTQRGNATWSALYGMATVVLPGALLVRGIRRGASSPAAAAAGFMFWELVKIAVAASMLVAVALGAPDLDWSALLITMVLSMKLGWLALFFKRQPAVSKIKKRV